MDDLQGHVHLAGQDGGVADTHNGRGIEEDKIIALLQFADQIFHLCGAEDAEGTAGQFAAGQEIHGRDGAGLDHFFQRVLFQQIVGESEVVRDAQHLMEGGPAKVRVHNQHALAALGKDRGEVEDGGGFAFARTSADNGDGIEFVVLAQNAISLGVRAFRAFIN